MQMWGNAFTVKGMFFKIHVGQENFKMSEFTLYFNNISVFVV